MQTKITQRTLAQLNPTGERFFVWDTSLTGFGIEVSAKGKASYVCETRIKGTRKKVRKKIGLVDLLPLDGARQEARGLLLKATQGFDIRFEADRLEEMPLTIGKAVSDYISAKRHKLAPSTLRDYRVTFNSCLSDWENLPTKQLSGQMVAERYNELLGSKSAAYCNKVMRNLRAALNFHGLEPNPVKYLSRKSLLADALPRNRFLNAYEIYHVYGCYSAFSDPVARVVLFCLLTGARKNEALKLTWADITSHTIEFRGDIQKNHKPHHVPRVGILNGLLGEQSSPNELVLGYTKDAFRKPFERFKQRPEFCGWPYWTMHDLRRTFSEHMNLIGYTPSEVSLASNRSDTSVTVKHYLGGQLAKENLLRRMYADLQRQVVYYWEECGVPNTMVAPVDYEPVHWFDPELSREEWVDYQQSLESGSGLDGF
ncbi:MAG: site-specific integrase [Paracoccaceae bacterium]|nr:site-specific integrase [Paracoccaceae bacterium]